MLVRHKFACKTSEHSALLKASFDAGRTIEQVICDRKVSDGSKIHTHQPRRCTDPQVQGYRPESFKMLENLAGSKTLIRFKRTLWYSKSQSSP